MNANEEIGKRIRLIRRMIGITRQDLAQKYDIEYSTISHWETGNFSITDKVIHQCVQIFLKEGMDCSFEWIKNKKGPDPVLIKTDPFTSPENHFHQQKNILPEIQFFLDVEAYKKNNKQSIIHQIKNKAMYPIFDIGDVVGGEPLEKKDFYKAHSKMSIISIEENKYMIRYFYKKQNKYILTAENTGAKVINPHVLDSQPLVVAPINFVRKSYLYNS